jgi:hypothetical protein
MVGLIEGFPSGRKARLWFVQTIEDNNRTDHIIKKRGWNRIFRRITVPPPLNASIEIQTESTPTNEEIDSTF